MTSSTSPSTPTELFAGKYRLGRLLGEGGFGVVHAATNVRLNQPVAIKLCKDRRGASRMQREARAAARLCSPHVVRIYDANVLDDGTAFIVMEQLHGQTVSARLRKRGVLEMNEAAEILCQVCDALAEAHAWGLVHRDLKPSNLFLTNTGAEGLFVKVLDFGLVKGAADASDQLTASDALLGSPSYMSPEQVRGERTLGACTDVWALGVVLFELLTGAFPFEGESRFAQLTAIVADPPRPLAELRPDLPAELQRIIARCLRKDCRSRYESVEQLCADLAPFAGRVRVPVGASTEGDVRDDDPGERTALTLAPTEASPTLRVPVKQRTAWAPVLAAGIALLYMAAGVGPGAQPTTSTPRHGFTAGGHAVLSPAPLAATELQAPVLALDALELVPSAALQPAPVRLAAVQPVTAPLAPSLVVDGAALARELRTQRAASRAAAPRRAEPSPMLATPAAAASASPQRALADAALTSARAPGAGLFLEPDF